MRVRPIPIAVRLVRLLLVIVVFFAVGFALARRQAPLPSPDAYERRLEEAERRVGEAGR